MPQIMLLERKLQKRNEYNYAMAQEIEPDTNILIPGETTVIAHILDSQYDKKLTSLEPLLLTDDKRIFKAQTEDQPFVIRTYLAENQVNDVQDVAANLLFLETQSFPAERLLRTNDGKSIGVVDGNHILATTFIDGDPIPSTPEAFGQLAETLGKLHSLDYHPANPPVPTAKLLPKRDVAYALSELTPVKDNVPEALRERYDFLEAALQNLPDCEDLPNVFIHSDVHPGNGVQTENGTIVLYDWQDAGLGPAVIDLAYLLLSVDQMAPWRSQSDFQGGDPWPDTTIKAIAEGYTKFHKLGVEEFKRLPDALRFRSLILGAVNFAKVVRGETKDDKSLWWWRRYTVSEDIAKKAAKYLQ